MVVLSSFMAQRLEIGQCQRGFNVQLMVPKAAYKIIEDAILIHGHVGYNEEYPFEQMFRDAIAFEIIGGTEEEMKLYYCTKDNR